MRSPRFFAFNFGCVHAQRSFRIRLRRKSQPRSYDDGAAASAPVIIKRLGIELPVTVPRNSLGWIGNICGFFGDRLPQACQSAIGAYSVACTSPRLRNLHTDTGTTKKTMRILAHKGRRYGSKRQASWRGAGLLGDALPHANLPKLMSGRELAKNCRIRSPQTLRRR